MKYGSKERKKEARAKRSPLGSGLDKDIDLMRV
jgi:hypothetical protein